MNNQITIREAVTEADIEVFWAQLYAYYRRDILPDLEDGDREHFLSSKHRSHMQAVHDRPQDWCRYLFFERSGTDIGFAMPVIFTSEDGKCFLAEFCVFPEFRGGGTGTQCAQGLSSLTVCCAPCDEGMYQVLGFPVRLGAAFTHLT